MYKWFDAIDLEASIALRPLLFTEGGWANHLKKIKGAYRLNDAEDNMEVYHYTKYADLAARIHNFKPIPESLSLNEYLEYANVDVQEHCFHPKRAVPWLAGKLGLD